MFRRQRWMSGALVVAVLAGTGCATRTVYVVQDQQPQQVAQQPSGLSAGPMAAPGATQYNNGGEAVITAPNQFYQPLSGYGSWVDYPGYGQVFVPAQSVVGANFRPYTYGHWEYTQFGWTWVDHHPFGWATGHYGNWMYDGRLGWAWVPGTQWAPAWVSWRQGGGYVGWAPMPPGAAFGGSYTTYDSSWVFCNTNNFGQPFVGGYLVTGPGYQQGFQSTRVINQTTVINNYTTYAGPSEEARREGRVVHRPIEETEREFATTRPPRGTVIDPSMSARNANGAPTGNEPTGRAGANPRGEGNNQARGVVDGGTAAAPAVPARGEAAAPAVPSRGGVQPVQPVPSRDGSDAPSVPDRGTVTPGQPSRDPPALTPVMPVVAGDPPKRDDTLSPVMPVVPGRSPPTVTAPTQPSTTPVRTPIVPVVPGASQPVQPAVPGVASKDRDGTPVLGGVPNYPGLPEKRQAIPPDALDCSAPVQPAVPGPVEVRPSKRGQVVPFNDRQPAVAAPQPVVQQPAAQPPTAQPQQPAQSKKGSKGKSAGKAKSRSPK
jgi:hypothetical protein